MKHITLWCYPRTGTTAYCEHLVNTKQVDSDEIQEFLARYKFWPCFHDERADFSMPGLTNKTIDFSTIHFSPDRDFKKTVLDKIGFYNIKGDHADYITENILREHYDKKWIWVDYRKSEKGIERYITSELPTQYKLDNHFKISMDMLSETNISYVIKAYTNLNLKIDDITYPSEHHLIIRDPLDTALSQIFANRTMVWHARKNEWSEHKFMNIDEIDFKEDNNMQQVLDCCKNNLYLIQMLEGKLDKFIRYEDIDLSSTSWRKLWTLEEKLSLCKNTHLLESVLNNYKLILEKHI